MAIGRDVLELQAIINYNFADISYLESAVTHASYTNEQRTRGILAEANERLEFLGDAVLQIVISEHLYSNYKRYREGALTKMRQQIVCESTLERIANKISLGEFLNIGHGEELTDCRRRPKILADALEAVIGAVYLDSTSSGGDAYKDLVLNLFADEINKSNEKNDYKTMLQQLAEQDGASLLEYRIIEVTGPEHKKHFTIAAYVNNNEVGRGSAPTKKSAEMQAAKMALRLFGVNV